MADAAVDADPDSDPEVARRRAVEATLTHYHALGRHPIVDAQALLLVDPARPHVFDANHVRRPRASSPEEIDRLVARIEEVYAHQGHLQVVCDVDTPGPFEARLCVDGWELDTTLQHLLTGPLLDERPAPADVTMRRATTDADWEVITALTRLDHLEESRTFRRHPWGMEVTVGMVEHRRDKAPEMQPWLASIDGTDVGMFSAMPGVDGIGLVEDLFVHPDARRQGVARTLIATCVADSRARGAGPVVIGSLPKDWPKGFYARLGFRPLFVERVWERAVPPAASTGPSTGPATGPSTGQV